MPISSRDGTVLALEGLERVGLRLCNGSMGDVHIKGFYVHSHRPYGPEIFEAAPLAMFKAEWTYDPFALVKADVK